MVRRIGVSSITMTPTLSQSLRHWWARATTCFGLFSRSSSGWMCVQFEGTIQYVILSLWYLMRSCFHQ